LAAMLLTARLFIRCFCWSAFQDLFSVFLSIIL